MILGFSCPRGQMDLREGLLPISAVCRTCLAAGLTPWAQRAQDPVTMASTNPFFRIRGCRLRLR